jgi:hypothetical protein
LQAVAQAPAGLPVKDGQAWFAMEGEGFKIWGKQTGMPALEDDEGRGGPLPDRQGEWCETLLSEATLKQGCPKNMRFEGNEMDYC